jgi:predicted chitinase
MFPLSPEVISEALGAAGPIVNVRANWPILESALLARSIYSDLTAIAAIATVSVETGSFRPVKEVGGPTYLADQYEGRQDLGNTAVGDGVRFRGRGFIQITGRWDYAHFGEELHRDLISNPDLALDPRVAAEILALYFHERGVPAYADAQKWEMVRRRVNGGMRGWPKFISAAQKLVAALKQVPQLATSPPVEGKPTT